MPKRPRTPQELRPCIAELLRTSVHLSPFLLRVEKILVEDVYNDQRHDFAEKGSGSPQEEAATKQAYRLLLSDGILMIQATIGRLLHRYIELEYTCEGAFVDVRKFDIKHAKRRNGCGEVMYLAITDFEPVEGCVRMAPSEHSSTKHTNLLNKDEEPPLKRQKLSSLNDLEIISRSVMPSQKSSQESDAGGGFETIKIDYEAVERRRHALHELSSNTTTQTNLSQEVPTKPARKRQRRRNRTQTSTPSASLSPVKSQPGAERALPKAEEACRPRSTNAFSLTASIVQANTAIVDQANADMSAQAQNQARPQARPSSAGHDRPAPPVHTLDSLLHPSQPLPKSYATTVLAVVTWVSGSLIHKPPFPAKRHIKIHDRSISDRYSGVTVTVFIDAEQFLPRVGTVALFRGVVAQRWQSEIILNAYSNLAGMWKDGEWFVTDENKILELGFDASDMKDWWEERKQRNGTGVRSSRG